MVSVILAVACFLLYRWIRARDARRQLMAVFFLGGIWFLLAAVAEVASYLVRDLYGYAVLSVLLLAPLTVLFVAGILMANGLKMFRREGRSLGNSLSGLLGVVLIVVPVTAVVLAVAVPVVGGAMALFLFMISAQLGVSFLVFWTYSKLYARVAPRPGPDAVVVLGSGLIRGRVPPLLAARLDRGREAFARYRRPGRTVMVPSGGQGPNEPRPEGEAMAEYLVEHDVAAEDVVAETRSRTTQQNLLFSRVVANDAVAGRAPRDADASVGATGADGATGRREDSGAEVADGVGQDHGGERPLLVVTNGYHAPRAALISRQVGVAADVIGARTARYFVPSAFLREFVAVLRMHRMLHVVIAGLSLLGSVFVLGVALNWF